MENSATAAPTYQELLEINAELRQVVSDLRQVVKAQEQVIARQQVRINELEDQVKKQAIRITELEHQLYGRKSEKQKDKVKDKKPILIKNSAKDQNGFNDEDESPVGTFPSHLPRKEYFENNLPQGADPNDYEIVGTKIVERIAVHPAQFYVQVIHKTTYKRKSDGTFPEHKSTEHPFGRCSAHISFIVYAILLKILFHIPFYRFEKLLELQGISSHRSQFVRWSTKLSSLLQPIVDAILAEIKEAEAVYGDESPTKVRCKQKDESKTYRDTYFWNLIAPNRGIVFRWSINRNNTTAEKMLEGIKGVFGSDALGIYTKATKTLQLKWQICWIHIRRNFLKATSNPKLAKEAVDQINNILRIDKAIRKRTEKCDRLHMRIKYRQRFLLPLVSKMTLWIDSHIDLPEVQTDEKLLLAINYINNRWTEATCFISHPNVLPHNNLSEQHFRYLKLGAKNWLFCASDWGAETLCVFYSLAYSAKLLNINPYYYLADLVEQISEPGVKAADLTPRNWKRNREHIVVPEFLRKE